ncbi:EAL and HDOD domain-containing protein [Pseudazoarcus pumilus]|uniref:Regulator n=1 Tax=Pseudazoarcus pumilus TaxID=2067960 RepID=A0A2I6S3U0_9RHOO|nr:HDOD domain-containing protein [Pseudazoarcus pumilus]AUN93934.1 regulator [Pseudazoarcus pumilus]
MEATTIFTREPVVNRKRAITANRLIAHGPDVASVVEALNALGEVWPTQHPVFISLERLVPTPDLMQWRPPDNAMIEIPAQTLGHPRTAELLAELAEAGIHTCLAWWRADTVEPAQANWRFTITDARKQPSASGAPGVPLAWGLADIQAFQGAMQQGFEGASGWFFLHGNPPPKALTPAHGQIVRLLNMVRNGADIKDIERLLKQDVAISYKLLRYINSAGFGLMCEIQSFRHAVSILGYDALNKWLSLLLVTASRDPAAPALMQTAIVRGRFMEQLGTAWLDESHLDNLFITGAFSQLPLLTGTRMEEIVEAMTLPEGICDALLHDRGEYAPLLRLARLTEGFDGTALAAQSAELQLTPEQVNAALLSALGFADSLTA